MPVKSQQLQIRVTPRQKAALRRLADGAGLDVSEFVLAKALPAKGERFRELVVGLHDDTDRRFVLAELHDLLVGCERGEFAEVVAQADVERLPGLWQNYLAAMVEQGAFQKEVAPPAWTSRIPPPDRPYFATPLRNLRLYLLQASPVPFKRRNIFVDSTLGARV